MNPNEKYMEEALKLAGEAEKAGEVPVGAVIVKDGVIIGKGFNKKESLNNPMSHAELEAISMACRAVGSWRLTDCDMYVTLEPCAMCAGAIINSRIKKVYIGAPDKVYGSMGSVCSLQYYFPEKPEVESGIMEKECREVLQRFFKTARQKGCQ